MDAQARKKALFRAKLNANKLEKRIESPLVKYNELDQPVCRVCDVVLKSESQWPAHQASRKHHEAINKVKANAAGQTRVNNVKAVSPSELTKHNPEHSIELRDSKSEAFVELPKSRSSSVLPPDFFDNSETKRQKTDAPELENPIPFKRPGGSAQTQMEEPFNSASKVDAFSSAEVIETKTNEIQRERGHTHTSKLIVGSETKQAKGALPEGFFDDKDADLRARGITPVKLDVKDEYKEFEKLIQEDLQEVDNRLEEEEIDAAEMIEEAESVEQKTYRERVDILKKKKMELMAARSSTDSRGPRVIGKESNLEESSSDDDSDENFTVDWRAKHL
ncbi:protein ABA AND ROS SENSITIVE 1-like isoform X2 [Actinidia eriantha]|uniref:protein ABA AND ROS SENSITIVE 1-like isoform X2 n=1 Tax=Actinidia eriantha TaxID=165200 RepID=UPI00258F1B2F|nr:protein ABA AND ROS SENSITIVE 1-like isoform X2 [Actinidia eriantha]